MPIHVEPPGFERQNPLDVIEALMKANQWAFERECPETLTALAEGESANICVCCVWDPETEVFEINSSFSLAIVDNREQEVDQLIKSIAPGLHLGHFERVQHEKIIMYRTNISLAGGATLNDAQAEVLFVQAVGACQKFFPAFNMVVWGARSAREAMSITLFETIGEA